MRAANVVEALPTARPDDTVLSAVRMICQHALPGLVVANEQGEVVGCLSSVDLLRLTLPRYMREQPGLARVFDERHADRVAGPLARVRVGDVAGEGADRIPTVRPRATVVEIAETMARRCCPLVLVKNEGGDILGIVTANRLLELLATVTEDTTP